MSYSGERGGMGAGALSFRTFGRGRGAVYTTWFLGARSPIISFTINLVFKPYLRYGLNNQE